MSIYKKGSKLEVLGRSWWYKAKADGYKNES